MKLDDSTREDDLAAALRALEAARAESDRLRDQLEETERWLAEAERLADRDVLTPLLNRRAFERELSRTLAYCARYETAASLVFFDMDGFKTINDRFGHAAGDAVLIHVADTLIAHVRGSDVVGRIGGDEFAVILFQAERPVAQAKAAELQRLVEAEPVMVGDQAIRLAASCGVRAFEPGMTPAQMLAEADAAMFVSKGGRR